MGKLHTGTRRDPNMQDEVDRLQGKGDKEEVGGSRRDRQDLVNHMPEAEEAGWSQQVEEDVRTAGYDEDQARNC